MSTSWLTESGRWRRRTTFGDRISAWDTTTAWFRIRFWGIFSRIQAGEFECFACDWIAITFNDISGRLSTLHTNQRLHKADWNLSWTIKLSLPTWLVSMSPTRACLMKELQLLKRWASASVKTSEGRFICRRISTRRRFRLWKQGWGLSTLT